jgi:predicted glycosyltransferase
MIHVQHLLGVGHLNRCRYLADALAKRGYRVDLVSGGMPQAATCAAGVVMHQLMPARSPDASFSHLVGADGAVLGDTWRVSRRRQLLDLFERISPQVLITESFPFGRRMLRFELLPLLEAARRNPACRLVIASIRDILQPRSRPQRNRETCDLLERYYDRVLVHSDARIAALEDSFAEVERIRAKLHYSGYIADPAHGNAIAGGRRDEVLVSAGGSATGLEILATAIAARPLTSLSGLRWRILVSPAIDDSAFQSLRRGAGDGVVVERNRGDFAALMAGAALSISQAGYNTVCDLLGSATPAVVIPFAEAGEAEQTLRALSLQKQRRAVMLSQDQLSPGSLAAATERALQLDPRIEVDLDGAAHSAATIEAWLEKPPR